MIRNIRNCLFMTSRVWNFCTGSRGTSPKSYEEFKRVCLLMQSKLFVSNQSTSICSGILPPWRLLAGVNVYVWITESSKKHVAVSLITLFIITTF